MQNIYVTLIKSVGMFTIVYGFKKQLQSSVGANENSVLRTALTIALGEVCRKTALNKASEHHKTTPASLILRSTCYIRNQFSGLVPPILKSLALGGNIFGRNQCHMPGSIEITETELRLNIETELRIFQKHDTVLLLQYYKLNYMACISVK